MPVPPRGGFQAPAVVGAMKTTVLLLGCNRRRVHEANDLVE